MPCHRKILSKKPNQFIGPAVKKNMQLVGNITICVLKSPNPNSGSPKSKVFVTCYTVLQSLQFLTREPSIEYVRKVFQKTNIFNPLMTPITAQFKSM